MSESMLPLRGYTVLDLTRARSGPTAARQMADWGANVIKIEEPGDPDGDGSAFDQRHGADFQNLHRNKRSVSLNLKDPAGVALLRKMAASADVLLENYRPGVKHRLGIDYETLSAINPRLVYASISGFGQEGPYADRPGLDQVIQGMSGLMSITGLPGQGPVRAGIAIGDSSAGIYCAFGVVLALLERERSGKGQWVSTSLLQSLIAMLDFQAARWLVSGEVPKQAGNSHPTAIPTGVFKTADGHINIAATGKLFARMCKEIGAPDLGKNPDYADAKKRSQNRDALHAEMEKHLAAHTSAVWIERLNKAGVPCGPIYSMDQVFADPQVGEIGIAQAVKHPKLGEIRLVGQGVNLSRTPTQVRTAAPELGENTEEVLREYGISHEEFLDLKQRRVV